MTQTAPLGTLGQQQTADAQSAASVAGGPSVQLASTALTSSVSTRGPAASILALGSQRASQANGFVNSIGVNTRFDFNSSPYVTSFSAISSALINSGIRHIRDGDTPTPGYDNRFTTLGQHGINHSMQVYPTDTAATITSKLNTYLPYVDFVEPIDEYDTYGNPNWPSVLQNLQKLIYSTVRGNSAFNNITVLGPSLSNAANASKLGPLDAYEDAGSLHYSLCDFNPGTTAPSQTLSRWIAFDRASTTYKPIWSTEVDLTDDLSQNCGLPDDIIAKYDPRTVTVRWNSGMPHTYFFEFADTPSAGIWAKEGLVYSNGSPKPQYTSIQSMISVLSDPGTWFTPGKLTYALSGNTANVEKTLLQKRDGTYYLLLWLELPDWNISNRTRLSPSPQSVTLSLGSVPHTAQVYTYGSDYKLHPSGLPLSTTINLSVSDAISIVAIK